MSTGCNQHQHQPGCGHPAATTTRTSSGSRWPAWTPVEVNSHPPGDDEIGYVQPRATNDDWRLDHRAPGRDSVAAAAHDLESVMPDFYSRTDLYLHGLAGERESVRILKAIRGNPDAEVTVYRSLPPEYVDQGIRNGDWVSLSRAYCVEHGAEMGPNGEDWPVVAAKVRAGDLFCEGYLTEFGIDLE